MEKLIVASSDFCINTKYCGKELEEVQRLLEKGWTVKFLQTMSNEDGMTAIFVLEKK